MKIKLLVSIIFAFTFLIIGIRALPNYAVNWDEPIHFGRGQAILHFFLTGERDYKSYEKNPPLRRSFYQSDAYTYDYLEQNFKGDALIIIGAGHPVLSDLIGSITNRIVFGWLGLLGDIESYHLYSVWLSAVLVGSVVYFTTMFYGLFAGLIAGIALLLYPLFLGESRFNIKDPPEAVYYALAAMTFYLGVVRNNWKWILISSVFTGFAFATKLNIVFLSLSLVPWFCIYWGSTRRKLSVKRFMEKYKKIIILLVLFPIIPFALYFSSWPMLWEDPISRFLYNLSYYKRVGLGTTIDPSFILFGINTYAPQWILFTAPLSTLVLSLIGMLWALRSGFREVNRTSLFILLWFAIPILRVMVPDMEIYGGGRQIMEYIPPMAILAGIGASYLVRLLKTPKLVRILVLFSFIPITLKIISLYPNESIYFNELIGGLKGAQEKNIPGWGNSLGSTYRQGVLWINEHAQKNAKLATVYELRSNIAVSDLRPDINFVNQNRSSLLRQGEYIIGVTHQGANEGRFHRKYLERFLIPVYEVKVDDVAVLKIWKNDIEHTNPSYKKRENKITDFSLTKGDNYLRIDAKQAISLTRVYIHYDQNNCTPPTDGYFELSFNGDIWKRDDGDFTVGTRTKMSESGALRYFFAAEHTRFIQTIISDKNSCLLNNSVEIEVYQI